MHYRRAKFEDSPKITPLGEAFFEASPWARYLNLDITELLNKLWVTEGVAIFVAENDGDIAGIVGGRVASSPMDPENRLAQELFWYVDPKYRGTQCGIRLLHMLEQWARNVGATALVMVEFDDPGGPIEGIYYRLGFTPIERMFIKQLTE